MSDEKLIQVVAALARGERPPCPWCGARLASTRLDIGFVTWACYTEIGIATGDCRRECDCYEGEIDALRETIDRAIAMLKSACDTASLGGDVEYFQVDNALLVLQGNEPEERDA